MLGTQSAEYQLPADALTVAAVQFVSVRGDIEANILSAADNIAAAADRGARVVVFPELATTAYELHQFHADAGSLDLAPDDERLAPVREVCARRGVVAVLGASLLNHVRRRSIGGFIVAESGDEPTTFVKRYLWGPEREIFAPGAGPTMVDVDGWRLSIAVCYDVVFPEHARAAAAQGAVAYLCGSAFAEPRCSLERTFLHPARAFENGFFVVFANAVGTVKDTTLGGGSAIFRPTGAAIARAESGGPDIVVATLDPADLARARDERAMFDRLPAT